MQRDVLRKIFVDYFFWLGNVRIAKFFKCFINFPVVGKIIQRIPVSGSFECHAKDLSFTYRADKRDLVGRDIFWKGLPNFEPGTLEVLRRYIDPETLFIDVGANTGIYSLIAQALTVKNLIAFEPVPNIYRCLEQNLINTGKQNFRALNAVASSMNGTVDFHVPFGSVFATSGSMNSTGFRGMPGTMINVQSFTVDSIVSNANDYKNIIVKIDAEGFEPDVLRGMTDLLKRKSTVVIFECHADGPKEELQAIFAKFDYEVGHIEAQGVTKLNLNENFPIKTGEWNFVASAKDTL